MREFHIGRFRIPGTGHSDSDEKSSAARPIVATAPVPADSRLQPLGDLAPDAQVAFRASATEGEPVVIKPAKPDPSEVRSRRRQAENDLRFRLVEEARRVPDLAALHTLFDLDRPRDANATRRVPDDADSLEQLDKQLAEMVKNGTIRDLLLQSPRLVIETAKDQIETFPDHLHEAAQAVMEALDYLRFPGERAEVMTGLTTLVPYLPDPIEPFYDRYFPTMHDAYVTSRQARDRLIEEPEPFSLHDSDYHEVLISRAVAAARLSMDRQHGEANRILDDIMLLPRKQRAEPLAATAHLLFSMDEGARQPIFDAIWRALEWDRPMAVKSDELKQVAAVVLPPLAAAVSNLPSLDHRQRMFARLHAAGTELGGRPGAQTLVNLLPATGSFDGDTASLSVYIVLESLSTISTDRSYIDLALIKARAKSLPNEEFKRVFDSVLERLEQERGPYSFERKPARKVELGALIPALGSLSDQSDRDARFPRLAALIGTVPSDPSDQPSLYDVLRGQLDTLSDEQRPSAQQWLDALDGRGSPPSTRGDY